MSDNSDEKLEQLLLSRRLESANPDLAQRIIVKARSIPQHKNVPLWQWIRQVCVEFHLPKPAYVLAGALLLGMVIGLNMPAELSPSADDNSASIQTFLSADEALL